MATIDTLTGNLLAEHTFEFESWQAGRTQRARACSFQVGGKGINVSKMLRRLGGRGEALFFAGGAAGAECSAWLTDHGFQHRAFPTDTETRRGLVVRNGLGEETTFLGPDHSPGESALNACAAHLDAAPGGRVLAVCGSLPGADRPDFDLLEAALDRWQRRNTLVVDAYGALLARLIRLPLALVKINAMEFAEQFGAPDIGAALAAVRQKSPVRNWVISDGARPVRFLAEDGSTGALAPPAIREVSPTGSGDVLLACLLHAWIGQGQPLREAIEFALPYAAANAAHPGVADFPLPV